MAGFARVASVTEIIANAGNLSIPLYVKKVAATSANDGEPATLEGTWEKWQTDGRAFWQQMDALVETLDGLDRA